MMQQPQHPRANDADHRPDWDDLLAELRGQIWSLGLQRDGQVAIWGDSTESTDQMLSVLIQARDGIELLLADARELKKHVYVIGVDPGNLPAECLSPNAR